MKKLGTFNTHLYVFRFSRMNGRIFDLKLPKLLRNLEFLSHQEKNYLILTP